MVFGITFFLCVWALEFEDAKQDSINHNTHFSKRSFLTEKNEILTFDDMKMAKS